jgi:DNA anti-recombination protein RmuC
MFKKASQSLLLLLMFGMFTLAGCSQEEVNKFQNGEPISTTYAQALNEKADALNTALIDLNTEIENVLTQGSKESDAYIQGLLKKREDLAKERTALLESLNQRQNALKQSGKQLDANLRHSLDSLTESGMVLRNTILPNPQSKTK